ncbi:transposable element Tc1 transposase [Trichonephila clavipes]|nr:transposable element Tc1 transposase [Trichonephila clavipes]
MWRRSNDHKLVNENFHKFLASIARVYPPPDHDEMQAHAGYSSRVARKKPFISLQNQKKHLEFTKTHQLKTDNFWKKVIFSDESKFNICGSDDRRTVWRKPNTALDPKNLRPTVKHGGGSVMQDNDPKHTARNVKMWCLFHCKQQLYILPQSPDINVVENLWATLETVVQNTKLGTKPI